MIANQVIANVVLLVVGTTIKDNEWKECTVQNGEQCSHETQVPRERGNNESQ